MVLQAVVTNERPSGEDCNRFVCQAYNWNNVAARTELVYSTITQTKQQSLQRKVSGVIYSGILRDKTMNNKLIKSPEMLITKLPHFEKF